jgi:hypothetical protein
MCPRDGRSRITFHGSCSQFHVALRVYPENLLLFVKGLPQYSRYPPGRWLRKLSFSQHVAARTVTRIYSFRLLKHRWGMKNQIACRIWPQYYDMIYLLTAIGFPPGGSSIVHIYTKTIHRTTQNKQYIEQHKNCGRARAVPRLCGLYPGICFTTEENARKNLSQGIRRVTAGAMKIHKHTNIQYCMSL